MSQIYMSDPERVEALQSFGYNAREAAFLNIAALHGGHFLRRQFAQYLGRHSGGTVSSLIEKLLANEHAQVSAYAHNTHIYHVCARPVYAAIGQGDNRNRREHQPLTIKSKLMALDFVLAHPHYRFFPTEMEKVQYFNQTRGVPLTTLPTKLYRAGGAATTRFFLDKYPIFITENPPGGEACPPVVSFSFVDEGQTTPSHFQTFLCQYGPLLKALSRAHIVYVAANRAPFKRAERAFEKVFHTEGNHSAESQSASRLLVYFGARKKYESGDFGAFDRAKLIRFRDERAVFSGERDESLYRLWEAGGDKAVRATFAPQSVAATQLPPTFSTFSLEQNYDLFGNLTTI